ncbi:MAG: AAA family ATPase [Tannerella sp.]|jgi:DNA replication protein DnaC|nr:AAA family ATPase [Tannerella sp.]
MNYIKFINSIFVNNNPCLIHGFAGTGKSTFVQDISNRIGIRCLKLAPTGLSAYNIDGSTIDSLLACYHNAKNSTLAKLEELYDYIIIDEISMVHYFKMDKIFQIIETLNKRGKMIKLILIGDPFQLPPAATGT